MAAEISSIARPYAEAIFATATESGKLDNWSDMLQLLASIVGDASMTNVIGNPAIDRGSMSKLLLDITGDNLSEQGQNLVKLLVQNDRVAVLPEIAAQFEALKNQSQGAIEVVVTSAFDMNSAQEQLLADALKKKFNKNITISSKTDTSLMGGIHIKAGDMVIDGSIKGQLHQLANELGI
ncbi:MAG: F0F1 ATP synthase subunit delta [Chromatiales bacterium]|jgi:F-type H+-transporting ATPase subunit delta